jgi:hypothetical protein
MNDVTAAMAAAGIFLGSERNLKVAKAAEMFLNPFVDLPCPQTNPFAFPASSEASV